jgi:putative cardiolipin synthase
VKIAVIIATVLFLAGCASLPDNDIRIESYHISDTQMTTLGQGVSDSRSGDTLAQKRSGLLFFPDGVDAFVVRAVIARLAEQTLDVQYYLYHSDLSGGILTTELWAAAERGVRVRLLLDDMDMGGKDSDLAALNAHENIQIRLFNPFIRGKSRVGQLVSRFGTVTRRAHNKAMIADNQMGIVGGRNIGDEYFGADPDVAFGDLDVLVTQPAVNDISTEFDLYWNSPLAYPVETLVDKEATPQELEQVTSRINTFTVEQENSEYVKRLKNSEFLTSLKNGGADYYWGDVVVLYDHPDKISSPRSEVNLHLAPQLAPYITSVKKELLVISPYFVPGEEGVSFFEALEQRGVQVKIVTNSLASNDVSIVHAGYSKYRKKLLQAGVQLYEIDSNTVASDLDDKKRSKISGGLSGSKASLHAKYFVMDRQVAFIGSLNFDPRSVVENTEIGVVIKSQEIALKLAENFDSHIQTISYELKLEDGDIRWYRYANGKIAETWDVEPETTWWLRFKVSLMKLLPVESQL